LRSRPRYEMPPVPDRGAARAPGGVPEPAGGDRAAGEDQLAPLNEPSGAAGATPDAAARPESPAEPFTDESLPLFPPGPLDHAAIAPTSLRLACGARRAARARALDAQGRSIDTAFRCSWQLLGGVGRLEPESADTPEVVVVATDAPCAGTLRLRVEVDGPPRRHCDAEAPILVIDQLGPARSGEGIPAPTLVEDPGAPWRSRWLDERWEVNAAHRDYRACAEKPTHKLRYLAALFAKEIVLRSSGDPRLEQPLEQLVEVFSYADLRLVRSPQRKLKGE
jgi:hypothetical protein